MKTLIASVLFLTLLCSCEKEQIIIDNPIIIDTTSIKADTIQTISCPPPPPGGVGNALPIGG